jgi:hypothetical protein
VARDFGCFSVRLVPLVPWAARVTVPSSLRDDRLGGQADVIAALVEQRYAACCQPIRALPEHWRAAGPGIRCGSMLDWISRGNDDERTVQRGHQGNEVVLCHQPLVSRPRRAIVGVPAMPIGRAYRRSTGCRPHPS